MRKYETVEFRFGQGTYRDTGCPEEGGCERSLECKRVDCVLDVPWMERTRLATADRNQEIARMRVMRDAVGPDVDLMIDINQGWDVNTAIDI